MGSSRRRNLPLSAVVAGVLGVVLAPSLPAAAAPEASASVAPALPAPPASAASAAPASAAPASAPAVPRLPAPTPAPAATRSAPSPAAPASASAPPPASTSKPATPPASTSKPATTAVTKPASRSGTPSKPAKAPASKTAASPAKNGASSASSSTSKTRTTDAHVRRQVAGGPTLDDTSMGADTPELRALHAAERELFPPASPAVGTHWPSELPFPLATTEDRPLVHASGLSPVPPASAPPSALGAKDMSWLGTLELPDLPIRWDPRVVKYLEFFKDDPRGRATLSIWLRRSGRYRDSIRKVFRKKGLPEDLTWLAMIESGFEPIARSPVGAMGLWQFMPATGKIYGLSQDRWSDQRLSFPASTEAAADFLADLYRRFGSWDLAMAGYNMGYGGVLSAVRRYNTNDYWALAKLEGSFPWETTLYVPKILAAAIVTRNLAAFGYQDVVVDPPLEGEEIAVGPGVALATVAQACGVTTKEVEQLNPELRASRTPPSQEDWRVSVPIGKASGCSQTLSKAKHAQPATERYVVKFGETIEQIAEARHVSVAKLAELNGLSSGEVVRGGTVLLVPKDAAVADKPQADPKKTADKPVVVVPEDMFVYPDRRRVFYRVQVGDTVPEVCETFKITPDELRRWNDIDPSARLLEGMTMQIFAPSEADLSKVVVLTDSEVRTMVAGTDDFFHHWDEKGRQRIVVKATAGDTLTSIGKKHGVSPRQMERINRRGRSERLADGDRVVVWIAGKAPAGASAEASLGPTSPSAHKPSPTATPPLGAPPAPDLLPPLP